MDWYGLFEISVYIGAWLVVYWAVSSTLKRKEREEEEREKAQQDIDGFSDDNGSLTSGH